jgi:hypothetical protein
MRYPILNTETLNEQQRQALDAIAKERADAAQGPYGALLYAPQIASLVHELDKFMLEGLRIPERLRVVAELTAAAKHRPEDVQKYIDLKSIQTGELTAQTIEAIKIGASTISEHADENLVHEYVVQLCKTGRVNNDCFDRACAAFGREICLELIKICGFTVYFNSVAHITQRISSRSAA